MTEREKDKVHMQLCVFRNAESFQVINIKTFEGFEENERIFAYGFTEKGEPVLRRDDSAKYYRFTGKGNGLFTNLNHVLVSGVLIGTRRKDKYGNSIRENKHVTGFDAIAVVLGNNGLKSPSGTELEAKIKELIEKGVEPIYFYKQRSIYAMHEPYGDLFKDSWIISGKVPEIDLDMWNKFLKKTGSNWRVLTDKTKRLMRKLEYQRLMSEE